MILDKRAAAKLLDFGSRIGPGQRAQEQLDGAVAIHNLLVAQGIAYLADEVGMGKTYVALGAMALFRHYKPDFRVLIIAPRENIQHKWMKELRNFVTHNVRFCDMRVKALDGSPARPLVACANLLDLVHEVSVDNNRDFFMRLSSFSLPVTGKDCIDPEVARRLRGGIRRYLPWIEDKIFDLRNKQAFKDNFARALCCALPPFDLVIIDEGHNLKHGFGANVSSRNRVLGLSMGQGDCGVDFTLFPGFGPRARRVLFLSATPVEETYRQLWNQLSVFGRGEPYQDLLKGDVGEKEKKAIAGQFLIRRVTSMQLGGVEYTKNLYRREWRRGGVEIHDEPIRIMDDRQRLVVALVQKKVSELLGHERFKSSFQIGMLASFESFLETTRLKRDENELGNFDDNEQTDDILEREGIDVSDVNRLAKSYRQIFGKEMPHPKMDALVDSLAEAWTHGQKSLIFVRRVASVKELKRKLDERYDEWLMAKLLRESPPLVHARLQEQFDRYKVEKLKHEERETHSNDQNGADTDHGGIDTFFAWFFRGEGPRGVVSGANIQQRFIQRGAVYATFFEDNYVAYVIGQRPGEVEGGLAKYLQVSPDDLRTSLRERSKRFFSRLEKHARAERFEAVQAAAIEWLKDKAGPYRELARIVWDQRFKKSIRLSPALQAPDIGNWLELPTFFTEIRQRPELRANIWPKPNQSDLVQLFREQELRAQILASAARLGHGLIDLYLMTISRIGSIELRAQESVDEESADPDAGPISDYLDLLERQMEADPTDREWGGYDELADISANFDLILDVNEPDARTADLSEAARVFGQLLRRQQPVGGMSGQVNQTLVRQFRMPGYPLVLVTTDLLQEGEDLHTFCSSVHHYGISWTPSSMEQRVGRVDRVRSQTDRRIAVLKDGPLDGTDKLQVYFPHLEDTVEVLQVQRVLERMNVFLRLMHEGLTTSGREDRAINTQKEFARGHRVVPQILDRLQSAFPVKPRHLKGTCNLALNDKHVKGLARRFVKLCRGPLPNVEVSWVTQSVPGALSGTIVINESIRSVTLFLKSIGDHLVVRCVSSVGCIEPEETQESLVLCTAYSPIKVCASESKQNCSYELTIEGDILLAATTSETDATRVAMLVLHIAAQAANLERGHLQKIISKRENLSGDWFSLCQANDLVANGLFIDVHFENERHHKVAVEEQDQVYVLKALIAGKSVVCSIPDLPSKCWLRNRTTSLVGFRIDRLGRLVGEAWVPKAGLTAEEFQLCVRTVAAACDEFEYLLTGRDVK